MRILAEEFFQKMITDLVVPIICSHTKGLISQSFTVLTSMMKLLYKKRNLNIAIKKRRGQEFSMNIFVENAMSTD